MKEAIQSGSILFKEGTSFPEGFQLDTASYFPGWRSVKGLNGYALDRKTQDAGWTFFYLAGESRASAFGREGEKTVHRAIERILTGLKSERFNSLEVTHVVFKHFLGVPYATVSFHKRNMQEGMFLLGGSGSPAWKDARLTAA
jgi:hypothetical protein